jgi:hypothetical protein
LDSRAPVAWKVTSEAPALREGESSKRWHAE